VKTYIFGAVNVGKGACVVTAQIPGSTAAAFTANVTVDETGITGFAEAPTSRSTRRAAARARAS